MKALARVTILFLALVPALDGCKGEKEPTPEEIFAAEFANHLDGGCPITQDLSMKVPDSIHVRY